MRTALLLIVLAIFATGCIRRPVILSSERGHQLAKPATVWVWAADGDGQFIRVRRRAQAGYYLYPQHLIEGDR